MSNYQGQRLCCIVLQACKWKRNQCERRKGYKECCFDHVLCGQCISLGMFPSGRNDRQPAIQIACQRQQKQRLIGRGQ